MAISRKGNVENEPAPAHSPAVAHRREIPGRRNGTQSYTLRGGTRASRPTDGFAANRTRCHFKRSREIPRNRNENKRTQLTQNTRPQGFPAAPAKCPRWRTVVHRCHFERARRFIRSNIIQPIGHDCHFERRRSRSREIPSVRNETIIHPLPQNTRPQGYPADGKLCVRGIDTQRALWYNNPVNKFAPHVRKRSNDFIIARQANETVL